MCFKNIFSPQVGAVNSGNAVAAATRSLRRLAEMALEVLRSGSDEFC